MDTDTKTTPVADLEVDGRSPVEKMKEHFVENSQIKPNGVREVNRAGFDAAMLSVGVSPKDAKRVQEAVDHATTAAAEIAADDLEGHIGKSSKAELKDEEHRRSLSSTVRLPTYGGSTHVTVQAEKTHIIPGRGDTETSTGVKHGVIGVKINTKGRIDKQLPGSISDRMRKAMNLD